MNRESQTSAGTFHSGSDAGYIARNGLLIAPEFEHWLRANRLDSIDRLFADDVGVRMDKPGLAPWRQRRRVDVVLNEARTSFYIKRFENPPRRATQQSGQWAIDAHSIAGVEWGWMHHLRKCGISCPSAVALGEEFAGRHELRSVVVSAAVSGQSLEKWVAHWPEIQSRRGEMIESVATLVRQLHALGLVHRDLYLSHIFFDPSRLEGAYSLIDLQRVFKPRWGFLRWVVKDLASLNYSTPTATISKADRVRWLRAYLGKAKLERDGQKLAYLVIGKTARIARRALRHAEASC